jgi:hypothetical protein
MSTQIRTGVIRVEVGDNKPLYDTHVSATLSLTSMLFIPLETSYWNRTNINCFEDRCTIRCAKDAISGRYCINTNEETRTLMPQVERHHVLSMAWGKVNILLGPCSMVCYK